MVVEQIKIDKYNEKSEQELKRGQKLRREEKNFFFESIMTDDIDRQNGQ